jgi:4-amino-4-deoxy-L-arabinose transferase-like glycosyltransferase
LPEGFTVNGIPGRAFFSSRRGRILAAGLLAAAYLIFLLTTLRSVPFHPDEATYIFMSRDLDRILESGPLSICWRTGGGSDPLQVERERDCPLARYSIGLARIAEKLPATDSNWNWNVGWKQNLEQGALPSDALLFLSRIPQTLMLFLAVLLMARIGGRLGGGAGAFTAAVLFGLNSQVLLHARRAMSESALLLGIILVVAVVLEQKKAAGRWARAVWMPLLVGAALAFAVLAKYSGLLLVPVALAGMFLGTGETTPRRIVLRGMARCGVMLLGFLVVFLVCNPVFWCDPMGTLSAVLTERQRLLGEQVNALRTAAPALILGSLPMRLIAVLYELFLAPLAFWDIPNYAEMTAAAERAYLSQPFHSLTAQGFGSVLFGLLFLFGLGVATARSLKRGADAEARIVAVWFLAVFVGIIAEVPILWQRYYLPLIPIGAALSAIAVGAVVEKIRRSRRSL